MHRTARFGTVRNIWRDSKSNDEVTETDRQQGTKMTYTMKNK